MVVLLLAGFVLVRVADKGGQKVSQDEALAIARPHIDFDPNGHQVRFIRQGIPSHGFWVVSFYLRKSTGGYERVTVVLVDASSGRVTEVRRTQ